MNNLDEKAFIASSMSQILEILEMLSTVKTNAMRIVLNPYSDNEKSSDDGTFLLSGTMNDVIISNMMNILKSRLTELEMNYFSLKEKNLNKIEVPF